MPSIDITKQCELVSAEYTRLVTQYDSLVTSSFEDFKYLGAIGALIAWPPIAAAITGQEPANTQAVLLVGFIGILCIVVIIALRDILKWQLANYYLARLAHVEQILDSYISNDTGTFAFAKGWPGYQQKSYLPFFTYFALVFFLVLLCVPIIVFAHRSSYTYIIYYVLAFSSVMTIYLVAVKRLLRLWTERLDTLSKAHLNTITIRYGE